MPRSSRIDRRFLPLIFLLAFLVHAQTLEYWFVASDTLPLIETSRIESLRGLVGLFTQPLMSGSDFLATAVFYRPVASLSYALDYALWGLNPFGYHLTNVVLHAAAVVLVAITVTEVTDRPAVGSLTAVLFAVHPITVDIVPVIARRQDVLFTVFVLAALWLFVRWYHRWERTQPAEASQRLRPYRPLVGALCAYAFALGAKETALLVPGLVLAWVLVQRGIARPRRTVRMAVGAVSPFVAVTGLYVALRLVALGGLGGYRAEIPAPYTPENVLLFAAKYVLWTVFPVGSAESGIPGVLAAVLRDVSPTVLPLLVLIPAFVMLGGVALVALVRRGYFPYGPRQTVRTLAPVGCVVGFAAVLLALALISGGEPRSSEGVSMIVGYVTGVLFVGGCGAGVVAAALVRNPPLDDAVRRQLLFFGCWFAVPFGFLLVSGFLLNQPLLFGFGIQNAYVVTVPVLAGLSLISLTAVERARDAWRGDDTRLDANVVVVVFVALLLVPLLTASPLVSAHSGWGAASELNQQSLHGVSDELDDMPETSVVYLVGFPSGFAESSVPEPHAQWVSPLRAYSIEAWLAMQDAPQNAEVRLVRPQIVRTVPNRLSFRTTVRDDSVVVYVERADTDANDTTANRGIGPRWQAFHNPWVSTRHVIRPS